MESPVNSHTQQLSVRVLDAMLELIKRVVYVHMHVFN